MTHYVLDTNVAVVANNNTHADSACVTSCVETLERLQRQGIILLDDERLILNEYMGNLKMGGQPGVGDYFMKWIWNVQADHSHCKQVHITPDQANPGSFVEFPKDAALANFDRTDRKFVAVALASGDNPEIINAVDSDWENHYIALKAAGLKIRFICPQHVYAGP